MLRVLEPHGRTWEPHQAQASVGSAYAPGLSTDSEAKVHFTKHHLRLMSSVSLWPVGAGSQIRPHPAASVPEGNFSGAAAVRKAGGNVTRACTAFAPVQGVSVALTEDSRCVLSRESV